MILPSHVALDQARERARGSKAIGTTGRGIGPAYEDKVARRGIRIGELSELESCKERVHELDYHNFLLERRFGQPATDPSQSSMLSTDGRVRFDQCSGDVVTALGLSLARRAMFCSRARKALCSTSIREPIPS